MYFVAIKTLTLQTFIHTVNFASAVVLTRLTTYIFEGKANYTN